MNPDLEVDTDALRRTASALAATASHVVAATEEQPPPEAVPRWEAADAAALAAEAARQQLAQLGSTIDDTARQISRAAEEYELADARAVTRLRLTR